MKFTDTHEQQTKVIHIQLYQFVVENLEIHAVVFTVGFIIIISIQPEGRFWQEPEPSQATGMALAHCILVRFLRGRLPLLSPAFRRSHFRL